MSTKQERKNNKKALLQDFANNLPNIRKQLGLSQSDLGKKVGLSRQTISSIERGIVPLTWNTMLAISFVATVNHPKILNSTDIDERYSWVIKHVLIDSPMLNMQN